MLLHVWISVLKCNTTTALAAERPRFAKCAQCVCSSAKRPRFASSSPQIPDPLSANCSWRVQRGRCTYYNSVPASHY